MAPGGGVAPGSAPAGRKESTGGGRRCGRGGAGGSGGSCRGLGGVERWRQRTPWSSFVRVCSGCWASKPGTRRGPGPTLCARPNVSGPKFRLTSFCNFASAGLFIHFIIFFALHKLTILFFVFSFFLLEYAGYLRIIVLRQKRVLQPHEHKSHMHDVFSYLQYKLGPHVQFGKRSLIYGPY